MIEVKWGFQSRITCLWNIAMRLVLFPPKLRERSVPRRTEDRQGDKDAINSLTSINSYPKVTWTIASNYAHNYSSVFPSSATSLSITRSISQDPPTWRRH
jgi:hypothetical protein